MKPGGVFLILLVLAIIAGIVVWAISRAQRLFRAQYAALILVAKARGFRFVDDPDPDVRIRMDGVVDGITVHVRARVLRGVRRADPVLEVQALGHAMPRQGVVIKRKGALGNELVAEGTEADSVQGALNSRAFQRAMAAATEPVWAGTSGEGWMDHEGVSIRKGGYQGNPDVISQMIDRAVEACRVYQETELG